VISDVSSQSNLEGLGSAVAVGEQLRRTAIAPEGSGRQAELVRAEEREQGSRTFYDLEYAVHLADRDRHEFATVVVDRGRLYTFAASTNEDRWPRVRGLFQQVVTSFTLLV
jgi:photosystem II oxygen-evolving enhancer protein 2